jgi:hypothetical protein
LGSDEKRAGYSIQRDYHDLGFPDDEQNRNLTTGQLVEGDGKGENARKWGVS